MNQAMPNVQQSPHARAIHASHFSLLEYLSDAKSRLALRFTVALLPLLLIAGCATPPAMPVTTAAEDSAKLQRIERANANLAEASRLYDNGDYDASMKNFLLALDSGTLAPTQQLVARKQMAFIHCVSNREADCREEFGKAFQLDAKFDLSPAESGHPIWGAVFRQVKNDIEARRSGKPAAAPAPKILTAGEKLISEAMQSYEAAEYVKSVKGFQDALKETLSLNDQITAHKFSAFSFCLSNRTSLCRQEFGKILALKADFDLLPAEAGHPSWGPSFRNAKARQKSVAAAKPATTIAPVKK